MGKRVERPCSEVMFNRQVNYIIIEKLWKAVHKGKTSADFYSWIDIGANKYTWIRKADIGHYVNLEAEYDKEESALKKTGLSREVMTGQKMIAIDGIGEGDWREYLEKRYSESSEEDSIYRDSDMQGFTNKLGKIFRQMIVKEDYTGDAGRLLYYIKYGKPKDAEESDTEVRELLACLKRVDFKKFKECEAGLRKEIHSLLKIRFEQADAIEKYKEMDC